MMGQSIAHSLRTVGFVGCMGTRSMQETLGENMSINKVEVYAHINHAQATSLAYRVVNDFGMDYVSQQCIYVSTDDYINPETGEYTEGPLEPRCIVGQILYRAGVNLDDMLTFARLCEERGNFANRGITFTDRAFKFLDDLQSIQDLGHTWGDSLSIAHRLNSRVTWVDEKFVSLERI